MGCAQDKEFPDLTKKQADFYRDWVNKDLKKYPKNRITVFTRILRSRNYIPENGKRAARTEADQEFTDIGKKTADILRALKKAAVKHEGVPTIREIIMETHLSPSSVLVVCRAIDTLIAAGYVRKVAQNKNRNLRLTEKAFPERNVHIRFLGESDDDFRKRITRLTRVEGPEQSLPPEVRHFANAIGITLDSSPEVGLHATVGDVELTANTRTGTVVLRRKDGTRLALELPPGDPIHRKAAFADLLWILRGAATTP